MTEAVKEEWNTYIVCLFVYTLSRTIDITEKKQRPHHKKRTQKMRLKETILNKSKKSIS